MKTFLFAVAFGGALGYFLAAVFKVALDIALTVGCR